MKLFNSGFDYIHHHHFSAFGRLMIERERISKGANSSAQRAFTPSRFCTEKTMIGLYVKYVIIQVAIVTNWEDFMD